MLIVEEVSKDEPNNDSRIRARSGLSTTRISWFKSEFKKRKIGLYEAQEEECIWDPKGVQRRAEISAQRTEFLAQKEAE